MSEKTTERHSDFHGYIDKYGNCFEHDEHEETRQVIFEFKTGNYSIPVCEVCDGLR